MKQSLETMGSTEPIDNSGGSFLRHLWASLAAMVVLTILCCGVYPLIVWGIAQTVFSARANGSLITKDGVLTSKVDDAVGSSLLGQSFSLPQYFHPRPSAAGNGYDPTSSGGSNLGPLSDKLINGATQTAPPTTQPTTQASATTQPASTQPVESLALDGLRLRTLHYALDNGLTFSLYSVKPDGTRTEVPLKQYQDGQGNLNDIALVDAFPHPASDASDRTVLVAGNFKKADGTPIQIPSDAVTASASGLDPQISPENAAMQIQRVADSRKITAQQVADLVSQYTERPSLGILGDPGVNVLRLNLALDAKYPLPATPSTQPSK